VPGVQDAALSSDFPAPFGGSSRVEAWSGGRSTECQAGVEFVSREYFETLGIRIERGAIPRTGAAIVVDTSAASKCWSEASGVDWQMRIAGTSDEWLPVVAVAADLAAPLPEHLDIRRGQTAVAWVLGQRHWP